MRSRARLPTHSAWAVLRRDWVAWAHVVRGQMMAGAGEDLRALFRAGVRAALEAWPALQVSGAAARIKVRA